MRITVASLFICAAGLYASNANSQNAKVSIQVKNVSAQNVMSEIENQTDYLFVFDKKEVNVKRKVSVDAKEEPVSNVLRSVFDGTDVSYVMVGDNIVLTTKSQTELGTKQSDKKTVSGTVVDELGEPVIGANVIEKGSKSNGTVTDADGKFTLSVSNNATLSISYIGYNTIECPVAGKSYFNISLSEDTQTLEEVVVVGYGTQKKSNLTGSISSVKSADIVDIPAKTVTEAIQGKVAGVLVTKSSGNPGSGSNIIIRGAGSTAGMSPLYVIDGVPGGNEVGLNLNDVESIEVIKDASAAAIYGANAAGGVILITTKKGAAGKPSVNVNLKTGFSKAADFYELLDTKDYIPARRMTVGDHMTNNFDNYNSLPNTDWPDVVGLRGTGTNHQYNASISGADDRFNYYLSMQYQRENGTTKNWWEYFSTLVKAEYNIVKNLKIGTRINVAKTNTQSSSVGWGDMFNTVPYLPVYNEKGAFAAVNDYSVPYSAIDNPAAMLDRGLHQNRGGINTNARLYLDWEIIKGLNFNITGSAIGAPSYTDVYTPANTTKGSYSSDNYTKKMTYSEDYRFFATLNYKKLIAEKHNLDVMVGWEAGKSMGANLSATSYSYLTSDPLSFSLATSSKYSANGVLDKNGRVISQFGRLNYDFDNRYLLTFNIRRDGSPKFGKNNRYGVFPSVSFGWKLTEEPFFKNANIDWITMIKPRFSWGILGNCDNLGNYTYQPAYSASAGHSFNGTSAITGYTSNKVVNNDIKWEEVHNTDFGIDIALLNNRFSFTFDWYKRNSVDMIYNLNIPVSSGYGDYSHTVKSMPINLGSIDNKGVEFSIGWRDKIQDFTYGVNLNISHNKNVVVDLGDETRIIYAGGYNLPNGGAIAPSTHKTENGKTIGTLWGLKTDGIISSQAEIDELNAKAVAAGHQYYQFEKTGVGDLKYVDTDGDGHITRDDCDYIGDPWPKIQYGGTINMGYKGFDFAATFVGLADRDVVNTHKPFEYSFQARYTATPKLLETSFYGDNGLTKYPRVFSSDGNVISSDPNGNYKNTSDWMVEDGSYLKIKDITFGYTFPKKWLSKAGVNKLRIYFQGNNLITFTKFSGLDPEFAGGVTSYGNYSANVLNRIYTIGLDVTF